MSAIIPLEEYVGTYGNFLYGNITVYLDNSKSTLKMSQGEFGHFDLVPGEGSGTFTLVGNKSPADALDIWGTVSFRSSGNDSRIDLLVWPLMEKSNYPQFTRDLKMSDAGPPDLHSCS